MADGVAGCKKPKRSERRYTAHCPMSAAEITTPLRSRDAELAERFWHYMSMMREVEDRIERKLYRQGKIVGGVYVGRGQEAIPVGTALRGRSRGRAVSLASRYGGVSDSGRPSAPASSRSTWAAWAGSPAAKTATCTWAICDSNIVSIISAMAACVPVAAGAALALKYKGTRNVAFCYFGDGATSRGDWHEGINLASVLKLPLVLICNNNQYAYSTPLAQQMACADVADRGPAYGIPAEIVDGNDVFAVRAAGSRAVDHARGGLVRTLSSARLSA